MDPATSLTPQREVEELLQFLYLMPVAVVKLGATGAVEMLNPKAVQLLHDLGIDPGHADGPTILDGLLPGLAAKWQASAGKIGALMPPQRCNPLRPPAGPLHLVLQLVRPDLHCTMLTIEDVTTVVEQERELARQRRRMGVVLDHIHGYCVAMLDLDGTITEWNPSIGSLFGVARGVGVGQPLLNWLARDASQPPPPDFPTLNAVVKEQGWCRLQAPWRKADGQLLWGDCVITPVIESDGLAGSFVAVIRDVTDEHRRTQLLLDETLTDPLTGLYNRRGLEQHVAALLRRHSGAPLAQTWIMLDIDFFKKVNDTYGHDAGDSVLRRVAQTLQETSRKGDILARIGGEEFALLLPDVAAPAVMQLAERLRLRVAALEVTIKGGGVRVTVSLGVAQQASGETWIAALARADVALYLAKQEGRNRVMLAAAQPRAAQNSTRTLASTSDPSM
jgi:diguanylate cyclase (GGDEF)-like protein/PAS domain S-box-containing protein